MTTQTLVETLEVAFRQCRDMDASLNERLAALADAVRSVAPPFADAVDRLVARLQQSGAGAAAPRSGDPMPPFVLPDDTGRIVSLDQLLAPFVDPDYRRRMAIADLLAALRSAKS